MKNVNGMLVEMKEQTHKAEEQEEENEHILDGQVS